MFRTLPCAALRESTAVAMPRWPLLLSPEPSIYKSTRPVAQTSVCVLPAWGRQVAWKHRLKSVLLHIICHKAIRYGVLVIEQRRPGRGWQVIRPGGIRPRPGIRKKQDHDEHRYDPK